MTLGYIEEDNPVKFYFRVKPLLVKDGDGCHLIEGAENDYPSDGCIRVVPDKNEIGYFKNRMRALGRYCAIDLRRHTGENDKIRQNKNYGGENGDRNAFIVYSDVITAPSPLLAAEVVTPDQDGVFPAPGTKYVAVMHDGRVCGVYEWEAREEGACLVGENLTREDMTAAADKLVSVEFGGMKVTLLTDLEKWGVADPAGEGDAPVEEAAPEPAPEPAQAPAERPEPSPAKLQEKAAEPARPAQEKPHIIEEKEKPVRPAEDRAEGEGKARAAHTTTIVLPRVVTAKYATRKQSLQAQSGYNPRRSASIKDIVDDLWRQSRLDQLGHPVPPEASSEPLVSPVDKAIAAVREAWRLPEARASVVSGLLKLEDLDVALGANGETDAPEKRKRNEEERQLSRLESDRLKLLCEIDELRKLRADKRAEMVEELKRARASEFTQLDKRNKDLSDTQERLLRETENARVAAREVAGAVDAAVTNDMDARLAQNLIDSRARDMMVAMSAPHMVRRDIATEDMTPGELVSAVRVRMKGAGLDLDNDEAVNLLACLYLGRVIALSGPTGSGKSHTARTLAAALGLRGEEDGRFAEIMPEEGWTSVGALIDETLPTGLTVTRMPRLRYVLEAAGDRTLSLLMIDDANRVDPMRYLGALLAQLDPGAPARLMTRGGEVMLGDSLRVILTLQDQGAGLAVDSRLWDRAWALRLQPEKADSPLFVPKTAMPAPEKAISLNAFKAAFDTSHEIPSELVERLTLLRRKLGDVGVRLTRRTLNDIRDYCAAVQGLMTAGPIEILDRAFAQRAMPAILAQAELDALRALPEIMPDMPRSLQLMAQPLPLPEL